jgi:hypothetical protein
MSGAVATHRARQLQRAEEQQHGDDHHARLRCLRRRNRGGEGDTRPLAGSSGAVREAAEDRAGRLERRSLSLPGGAHAQSRADDGIQCSADGRFASSACIVPGAIQGAALDRARFHRERETQEVARVLRLARSTAPSRISAARAGEVRRRRRCRFCPLRRIRGRSRSGFADRRPGPE